MALSAWGGILAERHQGQYRTPPDATAIRPVDRQHNGGRVAPAASSESQLWIFSQGRIGAAQKARNTLDEQFCARKVTLRLP